MAGEVRLSTSAKASELKKPDTTYEYKADTYKQSHLRGDAYVVSGFSRT